MTDKTPDMHAVPDTAFPDPSAEVAFLSVAHAILLWYYWRATGLEGEDTPVEKLPSEVRMIDERFRELADEADADDPLKLAKAALAFLSNALIATYADAAADAEKS